MIPSIDIILDDMLKNLDNYDGSIESGIQIIESNQQSLEKLSKFFENSANPHIDDIYENKLKYIIDKQRKLLLSLGHRKKELLNMMNQVTNREKVVNSYLSTNVKSIFIDKDM